MCTIPMANARGLEEKAMIYVVEIPEEGHARAWFAFDRQDFVRKVRIEKNSNDCVLFAAVTPRHLLEAAGQTPDSPGVRDEHADLCSLADAHGWDTVLYRADYVLEPGVYQTEPVEEFDACVGALAHDLRDLRIHMSDRSASIALYQDPIYDLQNGFHAHMALREQLIAMEVISDEL